MQNFEFLIVTEQGEKVYIFEERLLDAVQFADEKFPNYRTVTHVPITEKECKCILCGKNFKVRSDDYEQFPNFCKPCEYYCEDEQLLEDKRNIDNLETIRFYTDKEVLDQGFSIFVPETEN